MREALTVHSAAVAIIAEPDADTARPTIVDIDLRVFIATPDRTATGRLPQARAASSVPERIGRVSMLLTARSRPHRSLRVEHRLRAAARCGSRKQSRR